jgi:ABC-type Fe3+-hydroxamate transport system substrate-binding protein
MMHLPEEAPLSEDAIRILDSSLPSLLGRTHHTQIGLAVPLSSTSAAGSVAGSTATAAQMGAGGSSSSSGLHTGGTLDSMSRSTSVHEQMSNLAATLALQEAAGQPGSLQGGPQGPGSQTDHDSVTTACTDAVGSGLITPDQQLMLQQVQGWGPNPSKQQQQRFSLDVDTAQRQQQQQQAEYSRGGCIGLSLDTPTASAAASSALGEDVAASLKQQQQQGAAGQQESEQSALLQPELSLTAGLGAGSQQQQQQFGPTSGSLGALAAAGAAAAAGAGAGLTLPPKKAPTSSSSLSGMWASGGTPKAAAAAAVAAAAAAQGSNAGALGSIVSLSPAATDILIALGLYKRVVGVTDSCRLSGHGSSGGSSGGGSSSAGSGCWQVLQLLEAMGVPWVTEAVEAATASIRDPDIVCQLVEGVDGLPRYKLDEDCIRQLQPSLVVVACDENSGEVPQCQHYQQLQKTRGGAAAGAAAVGLPHGVGRSGGTATCSSTVNAAVAVPGRVRLDPHVVQRVLQRAGVWGEGRAVVLYQRCHSLAEVLEFMLVLAQAAGVPERGALLVEGLRARLRATAGRICLAGERLAGSSLLGSSSGSGSSGSRRSLLRGASLGGAGSNAAAAGTAGSGRGADGPVVMVLGCTYPLSLVGFWVPEMLQLLGLEPATLGPAPGEAHAELTWAQLREAAPDVLVLALAGLPAAQAALQLADLATLPGFWALPAVRAGAVYALDHAQLMRPGPSLVLGLEVLSHLAGPEQQPLPAGLPMGSVQKLSLHGGQRCRPRLVPHYMARYC